MESLNFFDSPGSKGWEFKDLQLDIDAGRLALKTLKDQFEPKLWDSLDKHALWGNHEYRVVRLRELAEYRRFKKYLSDGIFGFKDFGFKEHAFLKIIVINGVAYCHYFVNPLGLTDRPIGGTIDNKLNKLKCSFTMGHQQGLQVGMQHLATGKRIRGVVAGSFYEHHEDYMGPQKNLQHWRGMLVKHEVHAGDYDLMEVSLRYLKDKWL